MPPPVFIVKSDLFHKCVFSQDGAIQAYFSGKKQIIIDLLSPHPFLFEKVLFILRRRDSHPARNTIRQISIPRIARIPHPKCLFGFSEVEHPLYPFVNLERTYSVNLFYNSRRAPKIIPEWSSGGSREAVSWVPSLFELTARERAAPEKHYRPVRMLLVAARYRQNIYGGTITWRSQISPGKHCDFFKKPPIKGRLPFRWRPSFFVYKCESVNVSARPKTGPARYFYTLTPFHFYTLLRPTTPTSP